MPLASKPAVSVIIPTFNRATLLPAAIGSVLAQSYKDYEIIIVDDGSQDATREALEDLIQAGRICYVYQENRGESAARNRGTQLAAGEYLLYLDSDDLLLPDTLARQVACLDARPEVGLVHGGYVKFDNAGNDLGYRDTTRFSGRLYPRILLEWGILMAVPTVMVRAALITEVGGFDESLRQAADLDMWRRLARRTRFEVLPGPLARIRVHDHGVSADKSRAGPMFEIYLRKAFREDAALGPLFRRRSLAGMYTNVGLTLLGEASAANMRLVRRYCLRALQCWPFRIRPWLGLAGSLFGAGFRRRLAARWRQYCYPRGTVR
jgi:glycosyltransferase involved in cell wall biosynthesis